MTRRGAAPLRGLAALLVWCVLLGSLGALAVGVVVPRLAGATTYTVLTGSMRPQLEPGHLVVVRPVPVEEIGIGSTITYQLRSGDPQTVTHRVVGLTYSPDGERMLTTRGDANASPDPEPVRAEQVQGEVWYSVPWMGRVSTWATPAQRNNAVRVVAGALIAYALLMLVAGRRRRTKSADGPQAVPAVVEPAVVDSAVVEPDLVEPGVLEVVGGRA